MHLSKHKQQDLCAALYDWASLSSLDFSPERRTCEVESWAPVWPPGRDADDATPLPNHIFRFDPVGRFALRLRNLFKGRQTVPISVPIEDINLDSYLGGYYGESLLMPPVSAAPRHRNRRDRSRHGRPARYHGALESRFRPPQ